MPQWHLICDTSSSLWGERKQVEVGKWVIKTSLWLTLLCTNKMQILWLQSHQPRKMKPLFSVIGKTFFFLLCWRFPLSLHIYYLVLSPFSLRVFCQTCSPTWACCRARTHTLLFLQLKTPTVIMWYQVGWIFHFHFIWLSCWLSVGNSSFVWARGLWIWISGSLLAHLRNALGEITKGNETCSL